MDVLKASAKSPERSGGGSSRVLREKGRAEIQAIGGALNRRSKRWPSHDLWLQRS